MTSAIAERPQNIAVSASDFNLFGCPHCGSIFGNFPMSGGGTSVFNCADCKKSSLILTNGLTTSSIGIGDDYPKLSPHPRMGHPVDREKAVRDRNQKITDAATTDLVRWMDLGCGSLSLFGRVGEHTSKSRTLPIICSAEEGGVQVTWFAYNYHDYFLGVYLDHPVPAPLLQPIANVFGDYALSGHVNRELAPAVSNFASDYHNLTQIQKFGCFAGGHGIQAALVLRHIVEMNRMATGDLMDTCFHKTSYGKVNVVNGNAIEFNDLTRHLTLTRKGKEDPYNFDVLLASKSIFEKLEIDWYDTNIVRQGSNVHITLREGCYLPSFPFQSDVYVDLADTELGQYIPIGEYQSPPMKSWDDPIVKALPMNILRYRKGGTDHYRANNAAEEKSGYPLHEVYGKVNTGTRRFTFHVDNVLDAALLAFFFTRVISHVVRSLTHKL